MLYPSIQDLTKENGVNRYTLVIATAKSARYITYKKNVAEEAAQDELYEATEDFGGEDEKAVGVAVGMLHDGKFKII